MLLPRLLAFAAACLAAPTLEQRQSLQPSVTIKDGTVIGSSNLLVDSFKGIPFAQPPVGKLRLKPPQAIASPYGTTTLPTEPTACPQQLASFNTSALPSAVASLVDQLFGNATGPSGEDCLTLNVQRPAGINSTAKLPVVFWIYGGGFEFGSTQMYDGTGLITKSMTLNSPVIYVAVNYRVTGFGFLAGKELQREGSTNLGLRDQRAGLEWVADNIEAFGGDPDKVVIWGESAGSISVFNQLIINRGDNTYNGKPLFRGGIMDSGSVVPAETVSSAKAQAVFDAVAAAAGCGSSAKKLACLRAADFDTFNNAVNSQPSILSYESVNLSYLPRPDPKSNFFPVSPETISTSSGYAKVPIIIGDQEDEGTLFSLLQTNLTTTADLVDYIKSFFPRASKAVIQSIVDKYPDNASAGSPFGSGDLNEVYPQFKRLAALLGDAVFTLTRRGYLAKVSSVAPAWSYLSTYFYGTPILGTFHATDILVDYFDANPIIQSAVFTYYISFITSLNPNTLPQTAPMIKWPQYSTKNPTLLNFSVADITPLKDNFRQKNYEILLQHQTVLRV